MMQIDLPNVESLSRLVAGRQKSLFAEDMAAHAAELRERIEKRRFLVIGGGGSIGRATVRELIRFRPDAIHVLDTSENNLVELVRELRGLPEELPIADFRTVPIDFGSKVCHRWLLAQPPYDHVLNFAALKHVRSEKDVCSLLQMIDTNILKQNRLLGWLRATQPHLQYFSVSTDKAANPVNFMGATKRLMEKVIFAAEAPPGGVRKVTSARFANVAFSDGSLLAGWLYRLAKNQPLPVPADTKRYFVSLEESGHICLLAAMLAPDGHLLIPRLLPETDLKELVTLAEQVLAAFGWQARLYHNEMEAKCRVMADKREGAYPLLVTPLDTSGEKSFEEFLGMGETAKEIGLEQLWAIVPPSSSGNTLQAVLPQLERLLANPATPVTKEQLFAMLQEVVPEFVHHETGKNLDQRF
jgi:FlaA1/EpsC-like NDP-sugar epimerase